VKKAEEEKIEAEKKAEADALAKREAAQTIKLMTNTVPEYTSVSHVVDHAHCGPSGTKTRKRRGETKTISPVLRQSSAYRVGLTSTWSSRLNSGA